MLACPARVHSSSATADNDPASSDTHANQSCMFLTSDGPGDLRDTILNENGGGKNNGSFNQEGGWKVGMKRYSNSIQESGSGVKQHQPTCASSLAKVQASSECCPLSKSNRKENTTQAVQLAAKGVVAEKLGEASLRKRFKDVPAMVPIKKRKIHMVEDMQSPPLQPRLLSPGIESPPPSSPVPLQPLLSDSVRSPTSLARMPSLSSQQSKLPYPRLPSPESRSPLSSSPVPPSMSSSSRSSSPMPRSPPSNGQGPQAESPSVGLTYPVSHRLPNLISPGCEFNAEGGQFRATSTGSSHFDQTECVKQSLPVQPSSLPSQSSSPTIFSDDYNTKEEVDKEEEKEGFTSSESCPHVEDFGIAVVSEEPTWQARTNGALDMSSQHLCLKGIQGLSGKSKSGFSPDGQSRWDLSMVVGPWERPTDHTADTEVGDKPSREIPCLSISIESNESKHDKTADALVTLQASGKHETENCLDLETPESRDEDDQNVEAGETMSTISHDQSDWKAEGGAGNVEFGNPASWEGETASDGEADCMVWMEKGPPKDDQHGFMADSKWGKVAISSRTKAAGWDQVFREVDAEEKANYGDSESRNVEDVGLDLDGRASAVLQADIDLKVVGQSGNFQDSSNYQEVEKDSKEKSGRCEEGLKVSCCDSQLSGTSLKKNGNPGRRKLTGWDQLPEGFENADEAWKAFKESSSRKVPGRPWASRPASFVGFESVRRERVSHDPAYADECLYTRKSFDREVWKHDRRYRSSKFTSSCDRCPAGTFGRATEVCLHGISTAATSNEPGSSTDKWGSGHGHANAAAAAAAKVERSGFVVAPDGTVTKAGGGVASRQGATKSRDAGLCHAYRSIANTREDHDEVEAARNFPARVYDDPGRGLVCTSLKTGVNSEGRCFRPNARHDHRRSMKQNGKPGRQGLPHQTPFLGTGGMKHESRELPHRFSHPVDQLQNNSHTSPRLRPNVKVEKPKTSHIHRFLKDSKLVSTRVTPSQVSSSSSSKQSCEKKAGVLSCQDVEEVPPYSCLLQRRTAPNVAYGCPSVDEKDQQILPKARCSFSLRADSNSAISRGKFRTCGPEIRGSNEENDVRGTASSESREGDNNGINPKEHQKDQLDIDSISKRSILKRKDRRLDLSKLPEKDGRFVRSHKHASTWEEEDDIAPRRRRTS